MSSRSMHKSTFVTMNSYNTAFIPIYIYVCFIFKCNFWADRETSSYRGKLINLAGVVWLYSCSSRSISLQINTKFYPVMEYFFHDGRGLFQADSAPSTGRVGSLIRMKIIYYGLHIHHILTEGRFWNDVLDSALNLTTINTTPEERGWGLQYKSRNL